MARSLARIRQDAEKEQAEVLVVSVPAFYVSPDTLAGMRRVGFHLDDDAPASDAPDGAIRSACRDAGVPFYSFTERFREIGARRKLYFDLDGHFNRAGHELFAEEISKLLQERHGDSGRYRPDCSQGSRASPLSDSPSGASTGRASRDRAARARVDSPTATGPVTSSGTQMFSRNDS